MEREALTVADAIKALGGTKAVADLLGKKQSAVSNWRNTGFPANTFLVLTEELKKSGFKAPISLWGMTEPRSLSAEPGKAA